MPTVLLEKILELLTNWSASINQALSNLHQMVSDKLDTTNNYLDDIADDVNDINITTTSIDGTATAISGKIDTTNSKIDTVNSKIDTVNTNILDIKTNTGAVITPLNNIKNGVDRIVAADEASATKLTSIDNALGTISINSGKTAAFTEDTATDVHAIEARLQLISSDTTQMRADNQTIIGILNNIYDKMP